MIQRNFFLLCRIFAYAAGTFSAATDEITWFIRPAHDTPYHRMIRLKDDLECESRHHNHRFRDGACVKVDRRALTAVEGRYYEVNVNIFNEIEIEGDKISSENCRPSDPNCAPEQKRVVSIQVADDAQILQFELDNGVTDDITDNMSWLGTEVVRNDIIAGTTDTIAGTANIVKSRDGFVSVNVNSIQDNVVYTITSRSSGNSIVSYVELIPQEHYPASERHMSAPSKQMMQPDERKIVPIRRKKRKTDSNGRIDYRRKLRRKKRKIQEICPENTIDIMVVYTRLAMCADALQDYPCDYNKHFRTIESRIDLAIAQANQAYEKSGISTRLRCVKKMLVNYDEREEWTTILGEMYSNQFPQKFYTNRNKFGADIVHMVMKKSDFCGYGYTGVGKHDAYSVSNYKCSTGMYTLVHEVAHNMGCEHNLENASPFPLSQYSFGYQDSRKNFRSIMAYNCKSASCKRVQMFSTPDLKYEGRVIGSATANNALQIQQYTKQMSRFRVCAELKNKNRNI